MPIDKNHLGFGSILQDEEIIVDVFRKKKSYLVSRMLFWGTLFSVIAGCIRWINPDKLFYIWIGVFIIGTLQLLNLYLWWHMNALLMTNASLIKVTWLKFMEKTTSRIDYWDIDEIEVIQKGLSAIMYHFGDIHITKVSGAEPTSFGPLSNPQEIADTIADFKEQVVHNKQFTEDAGIKDLLTQLISRHVETNGHSGVMPKVKRTATPNELHSKRLQNKTKTKKFWISKRNKNKEPEIPNNPEENHIMHKKLDDSGGFEIDL